jgi:hypothetical protein
MTTLISVIAVGLIANACGTTRPVEPQKQTVIRALASTEKKTTLAEIDLAKIGHIQAKGRVQDKDYQSLKVIDELLANGKDSIPYLISKLDDETVIHNQVMDFWPKITVGDLAFIILSDFSLDSTWTKKTIPGTSFDELFETKADPDVPFWEQLDSQFHKHSRLWIKAKWETIWTTYRERIIWDEQERCFKVA